MTTNVRNQREWCLEFANTAHWHASDHPLETLQTYHDLLAWARGQQMLSDEAAAHAEGAAQGHLQAAVHMFERAIALREALYAVFVVHIAGQRPAADDLAVINEALRAAQAHRRIIATDDGFGWQWDAADAPLEQVLWPIVQSAAEVLTTPELLARVGQCADDRGCGWLFLDTSKNHSRRWCDINDCGNRAKQRRHYQRQRA